MNDDWKPTETCTAGKVVWLLNKAHFPFLGHAGWSNGAAASEFFDEGGHAVFPIAWMEKGDWTEGHMPPPPLFAPRPASNPVRDYQEECLAKLRLAFGRNRQVEPVDNPHQLDEIQAEICVVSDRFNKVYDWLGKIIAGVERIEKAKPKPQSDELHYSPYLRFEIAGVQQDIKQIREDIGQIREIQLLQSKRLDRLDPDLRPPQK